MEISSNPSPRTSPSQNGDPIDRARIAAILRAYGMLHASLFGSVARGEQRTDSDVDLLIDLTCRGASLMDVSHLGLALEDALGCPVDLVTSFDALHPVIQERLRREEEVLL